MTYQELKNQLETLREKKRRFRQLDMQIAEEQAMIDGIKGVGFGDKVSGGSPVPVQQRYIEHMERLHEEREYVMDELFALEDFIKEHLKDLALIEQNMIIDRYMNGKSWRKIQEEYGYEEAQPYRIVGAAIKKICQTAKDDSK